MLFQGLFELLLLAAVLYLGWRFFLRPKAEVFIRTKENTRLQQKMDLLRQKKTGLQDLQAERDVTKELRELEEEERGVQEELDNLEKKKEASG